MARRSELEPHGMSHTRVYRLWAGMLDRVSRKIKHYENVKVCARWKYFSNFYEDMGEPPSDLHQIDRIDGSKNYSPKNCRWSTIKEQARNRKSTKFVTYKGRKKPLSEWCEIVGKNYGTVFGRLRKGWSVKQALETPIRGKKCKN